MSDERVMNNKPYRKIEADDDFSMIYIEIGEYTIVVNLTSYHGEYSASVWYGNEKPSKVSYGEQNPAMAIKRCKQWIAENTIESEKA